MSLSKIEGIIRGIAAGGDFHLETSNGQIHITHPEWNESLEAFLKSPEGVKSPKISAKLEEIQRLNRKLETELLVDPEPVEDSLLQRCAEFLEIFQK